MGGVYRIQTFFGFLYFFLYIQGPSAGHILNEWFVELLFATFVVVVVDIFYLQHMISYRRNVIKKDH